MPVGVAFFYPKGLPHRRELEFASRAFNSIEINGSFYSLRRPTSYWRWYEGCRKIFSLASKAPRFITHMKKLRKVEVPLANFFASGVLALEEKLGPILWHFPPNFGWNLEWWATRLKLWRKGQQPKDAKLVTAKRKSEAHDLFVYFDNDAKVHAPFDAQTLIGKMK